MELTSDELSPDIFRLWSGIALVAGTLERRVWVRTSSRVTYPNLYVLLVGDPGVGKYIIHRVRSIWQHVTVNGSATPVLTVAPDNVTKASLLDNLAKAKRQFFGPSGAQEYQSLLIGAEEFGVLLPGYDLEFIGVLNSIYNNPAEHRESRRTGSVKELQIKHPQLNLLGGVQPGWLASVFPEEAWSMGLSSRMIMVYAAEGVTKSLFSQGSGHGQGLERRLMAQLARLAALQGELAWTLEAQERIEAWHLSGGAPVPTHSKLVHYTRRRILHLLKLMMISATSAERMEILEQDFTRALAWLTQAETYMPDIFRAMLGRSDHAVLEELDFYLQQLWLRGGRKPLFANVMYQFLSARVPADKVPKLVELAVRSGRIDLQEAANTVVPKPRLGQIIE